MGGAEGSESRGMIAGNGSVVKSVIIRYGYDSNAEGGSSEEDFAIVPAEPRR